MDEKEEIIFQEDLSESPIAVEDNDRIKTISYDKIPDVMDNLYQGSTKQARVC